MGPLANSRDKTPRCPHRGDEGSGGGESFVRPQAKRADSMMPAQFASSASPSEIRRRNAEMQPLVPKPPHLSDLRGSVNVPRDSRPGGPGAKGHPPRGIRSQRLFQPSAEGPLREDSTTMDRVLAPGPESIPRSAAPDGQRPRPGSPRAGIGVLRLDWASFSRPAHRGRPGPSPRRGPARRRLAPLPGCRRPRPVLPRIRLPALPPGSPDPGISRDPSPPGSVAP